MAVVWAIARVAWRETAREGVFLAALAATAVLIFLSQFLPFFGDVDSEIKFVKDMGFSSVVLAGGIVAVLVAAGAVSEEIEHRTALLILAKPVSRAQLVVGKYLGILCAEVLLFVVLGAVLAFAVWHKQSYATRVFVPAGWDPTVLQGLCLAYVEVAVLAAAGMAVAGAAPSVTALVLSAALFLAGHAVGQTPARAGASGWLLAWIPDLGLLRISDALALSVPVTWGYVAAAAAYGALYSAWALGVACVLLTRREVA